VTPIGGSIGRHPSIPDFCQRSKKKQSWASWRKIEKWLLLHLFVDGKPVQGSIRGGFFFLFEGMREETAGLRETTQELPSRRIICLCEYKNNIQLILLVMIAIYHFWRSLAALVMGLRKFTWLLRKTIYKSLAQEFCVALYIAPA
jgi:hypothetical protein